VATHDYVIANGTGAAVRTDLNGALAAIVSNNSSASEPATMYAYQWWADTTTGLLKIRNAANSAWVTIGTLASANLGLLPLAGGTMTGVLAVTAGTAALPGIAVSGDTNTGIYSPGADQVAISTGGTGRLFVISTGSVGMGTSSPQSQLQVLDQIRVSNSAQSQGSIVLGDGGSTAFNVGIARWNGGTNAAGAGGVGYFSQGTGNNGGHYFYTGDAAAGSQTARVVILPAGNVGIGLAAPGVKLEARDSIAGGSDNTIGTLHNFSDTGGDTRYAGLNFRIGSDNATSAIRAYRTNSATNFETNLSFWTNPTGATQTPVRAMTIDSSQRVGIGTASPANQFELSTDSAGKPSTSTWTIVSDERIKEDIELADLDLCYEAIKAIPLKRYKWRDEIYTAEQVTDRRKLGWIAQDVEAIFPKAVGTHEFKYNQVFEETIIPAVEEELDADGNVITPAQPERTEQGDLISEDVIEDCRNLNSDQIYAAMYGAIQKLMAKVEALEASNADLLARVAALEAA